jgi:Na+/melibiose symporter-like transporter
LPLCVAIILLGIPFLPKDRESTGESVDLDASGAVLFASGMFSLLFSLTNMANHPDDLLSPASIISLLCGLTLMGAFLVNEIKARSPVVDLELLRWKPFAASNAQIFLNNGAFNAFFNFIPYYATIAYGFSATKAGAILTPRSIAAVVVSLIMSVILRTTGYRKPWLVGIYLLSGAVFFTAIAPHNVDVLGLHLSGFVFLSAILFMGGVGVGVSAPPSQNANFDLVPDNIAAAAGLRAMFANSGSILGTTLVTLALSQFHDKVHGMQHIMLALAVVVFSSQIMVFMVPEMNRNRISTAAEEHIAVPIE